MATSEGKQQDKIEVKHLISTSSAITLPEVETNIEDVERIEKCDGCDKKDDDIMTSHFMFVNLRECVDCANSYCRRCDHMAACEGDCRNYICSNCSIIEKEKPYCKSCYKQLHCLHVNQIVSKYRSSSFYNISKIINQCTDCDVLLFTDIICNE